MPPPTALEMLIELASRNSDGRARSLGEALGRESSTDKRLQLLQDYRRDYLERFDTAGRRGLTATALVNFHHFLQKLDSAIEQQRSACERARAETASARADLTEAERKRKSLVTLQDRRVSAERVLAARREQRSMDEISARIATRGSGIDNGGN